VSESSINEAAADFEEQHYPFLKPPVEPSEEEWLGMQKSQSFEPLFFEWYKFVSSIANAISFIMPESLNFRSIEKSSYYVLSGLMHRCARLMAANVALSFERKHGETTAIVSRCLSESAIIIRWLCQKDTPERVRRFICYSLKPELELENQIRKKSSNRGELIPLEERMLASIGRSFEAGDVTREDISLSKGLPQLSQMLEALGSDRLEYTVTQRIGSHHVHGSFMSLLTDYLERDEDSEWKLRPRGHPVEMHINQYIHGIRHVLAACISYSETCFNDPEDPFSKLSEDTWTTIAGHYEKAIELRA